MKLNYLKIITLSVLGFTQTYAMDGLPDPFKDLAAETRPFTLKVQGDLARDEVKKFEEFQKQQQDLKEKVLEFEIIRVYANRALQSQNSAMPIMSGKQFADIENWVSKAAYQTHPVISPVISNDRILSVPLDFLALTLSINTPKPITTEELESHIRLTKQKLKDTERYYRLRHFGQTVLNIPMHELDQLQNWLTDPSHLPVANEIKVTPLSFKHGFDHILQLFAYKVGRNIRSEFEAFEHNENEKKSRVHLRDDLEGYFQTSGLTLPPTLMASYVPESILEHPHISLKTAIPKSFDPSLILAQAKDTSLQSLTSMPTCQLRHLGRFILSAQNSPEEPCSPELPKHATTTFSEGIIFQDGMMLNTADTIWALNHEGVLRIFPLSKPELANGAPHHSHLFQKDSKGLPVACAGHLEAKDGKITKINRCSGHYTPHEIQLILALSYFHEMGILADNIKLEDGAFSTSMKTIDEVLSLAKMLVIDSATKAKESA
jgi:hypothetical protein